MTFRQLKYFPTIYECKSLASASQKLYISQQGSAASCARFDMITYSDYSAKNGATSGRGDRTASAHRYLARCLRSIDAKRINARVLILQGLAVIFACILPCQQPHEYSCSTNRCTHGALSAEPFHASTA